MSNISLNIIMIITECQNPFKFAKLVVLTVQNRLRMESMPTERFSWQPYGRVHA